MDSLYEVLKLGDRVMAVGCIDGLNLDGWYGTVIATKNQTINSEWLWYTLGIEFDNEIPGGQGHDCFYRGKPGHCRWLATGDRVELLSELEFTVDNSGKELIDGFLANFSVR